MKWIATFIVALALLVPSTALAASSSCQAYNPQTCTSVTTTPTTSSGTLPFTGLDVALLLAGGGTLMCAGLGVRALSRRLN